MGCKGKGEWNGAVYLYSIHPTTKECTEKIRIMPDLSDISAMNYSF